MTQRETKGLVEYVAKSGEQPDPENDRREIDVLDTKLISLLQDRRRVSFRIQQRRLSSGGQRISPAREAVVVNRYRQALGPDASALVEDILRLCRGPVAAAVGADSDEPAR